MLFNILIKYYITIIFLCKTVRSTQCQNKAVRSTQGQNKAVRSTQGGGGGCHHHNCQSVCFCLYYNVTLSRIILNSFNMTVGVFMRTKCL